MQLEATKGELYGIEAHLKVSLHSVQSRARGIQNGVVCVEVDQRITSSERGLHSGEGTVRFKMVGNLFVNLAFKYFRKTG